MTEIEERAGTLVQNLNQSEEAGRSGEATIQSYIEKLEARKNELYNLGYELGQQVTAGMNAAAGGSGGAQWGNLGRIPDNRRGNIALQRAYGSAPSRRSGGNVFLRPGSGSSAGRG